MDRKHNAEPNKPNKKKMPPPVVKQTLTSYRRLLHANPLFKYQEAGVDIDKLLADNEKLLIERPSLPPFRTGGVENTSERATISGSLPRNPTNFVRSQSLKLAKGAPRPTVTAKHLNLLSTKPQSSVGSQQSKNSNFVRPTLGSRVTSQPPTNNLAKKSTVNNNQHKDTKSSATPANIPPTSAKNMPKSSYKPPTVVKSRHLQAAAASAAPKSIPKEEKKEVKKKPTLRRSLSSGHIQTKKGKHFDPQTAFTKLNNSRSEEQLFEPVVKPMFSPIPEEGGSGIYRNFVFKTPSAHDRRSIHTRGRHSFRSSTPALMEHQKTLTKQLSEWLKKRGTSLTEFRHLRCFGIHTHGHQKEKIPSNIVKKEVDIDEENKENVEVLNDRTQSFENLSIDKNNYNSSVALGNHDKESTTSPKNSGNKMVPKILVTNGNEVEKCPLNCKQNATDLHQVAKDALKELTRIIEEGYPKEDCVSWLELIREKYTELEDEPEYWECRAAIEKTAGNIGNAVEYYQTAIVRGAEVTTVEESLDCLLKKFSRLNISPNPSSQTDKQGTLRRKEKIEQDARNVFKSTIIQFALSKRSHSKKSPSVTKVQVTPVKRSTRQSRSAYTSTPGVELFDSMREVEVDQIEFKRNKALI